jgi:hypothetical protein
MESPKKIIVLFLNEDLKSWKESGGKNVKTGVSSADVRLAVTRVRSCKKKKLETRHIEASQ